MNTSTCRNCSANDFYAHQWTLMGDSRFMLPTGFFSQGVMHLKVCGACGLTDFFMDKTTLEQVKTKFQKLPG